MEWLYKEGRSCSPLLEKAVAFSHRPLRSAKECAGVFRRLRAATKDAVPGLCQGFRSPGPAPAVLSWTSLTYNLDMNYN